MRTGAITRLAVGTRAPWRRDLRPNGTRPRKHRGNGRRLRPRRGSTIADGAVPGQHEYGLRSTGGPGGPDAAAGGGGVELGGSRERHRRHRVNPLRGSSAGAAALAGDTAPSAAERLSMAGTDVPAMDGRRDRNGGQQRGLRAHGKTEETDDGRGVHCWGEMSCPLSLPAVVAGSLGDVAHVEVAAETGVVTGGTSGIEASSGMKVC